MNIKTAFAKKLKESRLTPKIVEPYGLEPVDSAVTLCETYHDLPCIRIPYADGSERIRYLGPLPDEVKKYSQPRGSGVHVFETPRDEEIDDVFITEGELKSIAGRHFLGGQWLGLGGVDMFMADGKLHPKLIELCESRAVFVLFDLEPIDKPAFRNVHRASMKLLAMLTQVEGCAPHLFDMATLPESARMLEEGGKLGVDDWIAGCGFAPAEMRSVWDRSIERYSAAVDTINDDFLELHRTLAFDRSQGKIFDMHTAQHLSKEAADLQYSNVLRRDEKPNGTVTMKPVIMDWRTSKMRVEIERVVYEPANDPGLLGRTFNRWTAPPLDTDGVKSPTMFIELVKHVAPQSYEYVINWLAAVLQWREKIGTCVVLAGNPGTGKSAVIEAMRHILLDPALALDWTERTRKRHHPSFARLDNQRLRSSFNSAVNEAQLVAFEEALFRQDERALDMVERVKTLITESTGISEEKYMKATVARQHFNLIMTTNHVGLLKLFNMDNDRRFCVDWSAEPMPLDWYSRYFEWLPEQGAASIYNHLMNVDLSHFDPRELPQTEVREEIAESGINEFENWFNSIFGLNCEMLDTVSWGNPDYDGPPTLWRVKDIQNFYHQQTEKQVGHMQVGALFSKRKWIFSLGKTAHPCHPGESVHRSRIFGFRTQASSLKRKRPGWIGQEWARQHLHHWEE